MESKDIDRLATERFQRWALMMREHKCIPVAVIALPLHDPLAGMKVFALNHTDRVALRIFLTEAANTVITDTDYFIIDEHQLDEFGGCAS